MRDGILISGPIGEHGGFYEPGILTVFVTRLLREFYGHGQVIHPLKDEATVLRLSEVLQYMLTDFVQTTKMTVSDHCISVEFHFLYADAFLLASWNDGSLKESEIVPRVARHIGLEFEPLLPVGLSLERAFDRVFEVQERDRIMAAIAKLPSIPEPHATEIVNLVKRSFAVFHVLFAYFSHIGLGDGRVFHIGASRSKRFQYVRDLLANFRKLASDQSDAERFDKISDSFFEHAALCRTFRTKRTFDAEKQMK